MPKRYRSRSRRPRRMSLKKRTSFKKRSSYKKTARRSDPFPASKIVTMRYCESITIDPGVGLVATHQFRANGIFDPNASGVGHQPFGHDQWSAIYNHYEVLKSKIVVDFVSNNNSITNQATNVVGIALRDDATTISDIDNVREGKTASTKLVNLYGKAKLSKYYNKRVMYPKSGPQDTSASFGSDPNEQAYFHVFVAPINTSIDGTQMNAVVTIEYVVRMWELKDFGGS